MTLSVTHNKTLTNPSTGTQDKVYGADYVAANSHTLTGTADVTQGGTGAATLTDNAVLLGNGTGAVAFAPPIAAGYVLTDNGPGNDPTFQEAPSGVDEILTGFDDSGNAAILFSSEGRILIGEE